VPYTPRPIDTSRVELPPPVAALIEELARNNHEVWARGRLREGWTWGPRRDDRRKTHPQLVPYDELPESEKQYDRNAAIESLKTLLGFGWRLEPVADGAPVASPAGTDAGLPAGATAARAAGLRRAGQPLVAYDVVTEGLARWPADVPLRQLQAMVLADLGCPEEALRVLEPLERETRDGEAALEETLGVVARVYKDLALASRQPARRCAWLEKARAAYAAAFARTGGYWTGINAATLAVLGGHTRAARALAADVAARCRARLEGETAAAERYWLLATLGEAALVGGRHAEACDWYARAVAAAPADFRSIASSRRNAKLIAEHLGLPWKTVAASLPLPTVVVFSGHMLDRPQRPRPRFPPALEPAVARAIAERLDGMGPLVCYGSAACGSDLLFLEAALARRHEAVVVLPYRADGFRAHSVDLVPGWGARFDAALAHAQVLPPVSNQRTTFGGTYYDFANQVLLGLATLRARQLDTRLVGLAVWDGRRGDGTGGTAATLALWNRYGVEWQWVDLGALRRGTAPRARLRPPGRAPSRRARDPGSVRALLFADVRNFSTMPEETVRPFVTHVLGLAGRLAERPALAPIGRESRGDGFYLVFSTARAAGRFALALSNGLARVDWTARGFPADVVMRIGLHAGVVYRVHDPITARMVHVGTHVNRAARIEPVTPPGQVWASQEFAALAALERAREFGCEYVGQIPLAKGYGVFPMYRLRG
jgi:adenylate cyclase